MLTRRQETNKESKTWLGNRELIVSSGCQTTNCKKNGNGKGAMKQWSKNNHFIQLMFSSNIDNNSNNSKYIQEQQSKKKRPSDKMINDTFKGSLSTRSSNEKGSQQIKSTTTLKHQLTWITINHQSCKGFKGKNHTLLPPSCKVPQSVVLEMLPTHFCVLCE